LAITSRSLLLLSGLPPPSRTAMASRARFREYFPANRVGYAFFDLDIGPFAISDMYQPFCFSPDGAGDC
jgi:hypothetical protein